MALQAKREAYHEAKMDSRLGWNSSTEAKKRAWICPCPAPFGLRIQALPMPHLQRLANLRSRPGYAAPAFANWSAVAVEIGCTFSERKRSSAAILPTLSNSGSPFT